jgi:hypothetical protein
MKSVLQSLIKNLEEKPLARTSKAKVDWEVYPAVSKGDVLTQDYLWNVSLSPFSVPS